MSALTTSLAQAIARFEGFFNTGTATVAQRNNNPGNLRAGPGAIGKDANGYAVFPDVATGWAALEHQVDLNIGRGLTLQEFFGGKSGVYPGYAPAGDNNQPSHYADTVAGWLGISSNQVLSGASVPNGGAGSTPNDVWSESEGITAGLSTGAILALAGVFLVGVFVLTD